MVLHSLTTPSPPTLTAFSNRAAEKKKKKKSPVLFLAGFQRNSTNNYQQHQGLDQTLHIESNSARFIVDRRSFIWGLTGAAVLGSSIVDTQSANAAKRRPPPPPPTEKKDPNVSGVQAKVLASMKRKEAMKETIAKLREQGKPIEK